ncbi:MAG: GntR family transcriptional regulator [Anaerolineaceae bacterium]
MTFKENIPTYFKIYQDLKLSIFTGEFEKGSKIIAIDDLAKNYGVASETMRKSINLLVAEGLLVKKKGFGTLIPESANISPMELGDLITEKRVSVTFLAAKVVIYSAEWMAASRRFVQLYHLDQESRESRIYKVFFRIDFGENYSPGFRGLMTHFFSEDLYNELAGAKKKAKPYEVLAKLGEWLDENPLKLIETIHPLLCVDENAKLLGLPDGTPAFYQEFVVEGKTGPTHFYSFISNAKVMRNEVQWNQPQV